MSTIKVDSIGKTSGKTQDTMAGMAKARAQYMGLTNTLQSGSLNHSSVTDNALGDFTHVFSNNFSDIKYSMFGTNHYLPSTTGTMHNYGPQDTTERATTEIRVESHYVSSGANRTNHDFDVNDLVCFGDLA